MTVTWAAIIGGILTAIVTAAASVLIAKLNNKAAPYAELSNDVVAMRKEQREMLKEQRSLALSNEMLQDRLALVIDQRDDMLDYIRELIEAWPGPTSPPAPSRRLAHALDEHADRVVETTTTTTRRVVPMSPEEEGE